MAFDRFPVKTAEVQSIPAFRDMPLEQLTLLASAMIRQTYAPGQIIFTEGEVSGSLWFVFEGRIKIIKQSLNGRVQGLCVMDQGKCFGSCPLFDINKNPASAQALDQVTLFLLPEAELQQVKVRKPQLVKALLHIYSQRLTHLAKVSEILGTWAVPDRINDCLLTYANHTTMQPTVELTHEKLAALSGTVREVVSRHLGNLEKDGIIRSELGRIVILNPNALIPPCACEDRNVSPSSHRT